MWKRRTLYSWIKQPGSWHFLQFIVNCWQWLRVQSCWVRFHFGLRGCYTWFICLHQQILPAYEPKKKTLLRFFCQQLIKVNDWARIFCFLSFLLQHCAMQILKKKLFANGSSYQAFKLFKSHLDIKFVHANFKDKRNQCNWDVWLGIALVLHKVEHACSLFLPILQDTACARRV